MSKPSELPRWAVDGSDVLAANTAPPSSGQRDGGWSASQPFVTSYDNRVKAFTYLWLEWLDATVNADGRSKAARVRKIPVQAGNFSASNGFAAFSWTPSGNGNTGAIPLVVADGERITSVKAKVSCGATDAFRLQVFRFDPATQSSTQLGSNANSAGHSNATEDLVVSGLTEVASSGDAFDYVALITVTAFSAGTLKLHGVELVADVP